MIPELPELGTDRIDAWLFDLDRPEPGSDHGLKRLPAAEQERARSLRVERDRLRFVACRWTLRRLLGAYLERAPADVTLRLRGHGKPELAAEENSLGLEFNVAHTGDLGLICLTIGQEIGCDVERVQPDFDVWQVAASVFSAGEVAELRALDDDARVRAFFLAWTRKEAFVKALGTGLSHPLQTFEVSPADERSPVPVRFLERAPRTAWEVEHHEPRPGYIAAVARSSPAQVRWRELSAAVDPGGSS